MRRLWGACAACALLAIANSPAAADASIDEARAAVEASEYMKARGLLATALAAGGHGPEQLGEIYRLQGVVAGALDDAKAATDAFERCLAVDAKCALPPGMSPKITRPFAAAQELFKARESIKIRSETDGTAPSVTVVIASDPIAMIASVRVAVVVDGAPETTLDSPVVRSAATGAAPVTIALPPGRRLDLRIAALDDRGNRVAELGSADVPIVIVGNLASSGKVDLTQKIDKPEPPPGPYTPRPLYLQWWAWGGAAALFGGLGIYFGIDAVLAKGELDDLNASSPNHTFDVARAVESRARRSVLLTNISYGVAGAFAIGAGILYLTAPDKPTERRLAPVVVDGGAGVAVGGSF